MGLMVKDHDLINQYPWVSKVEGLCMRSHMFQFEGTNVLNQNPNMWQVVGKCDQRSHKHKEVIGDHNAIRDRNTVGDRNTNEDQ